MTGYIDVGGGMRDIYGAGVLDRCMEEKIEFPYFIGVSAGSANIISFLAGQKNRCMRFYCDYAFRTEYMSFHNLIKEKSFVGLDYIYSTLSNQDGEDPLDYDTFMKSRADFHIVATDAQTGKPVYFDGKQMKKNDYFFLKASCCIPIACMAEKRNGQAFYDGGIADPIPIKKALEDGCDRVVITLTRPIDYTKRHWLPQEVYQLAIKEYPEMARAIVNSSEKYNEGLRLAKKLQKEGKALIIAPDDCCHVETLIKNKRNLKALYQKGYEDAKKIKAFV